MQKQTEREECLVGIGGSATNDGGFGLARSIGWTFLDSEGRSIDRWIKLGRLNSIVPPKEPLNFKNIIIAVDVQNPLLGAEGAAASTDLKKV